MKKIAGVFFLAMTLMPSIASAQKMVILTRHAERADGAATMAPASGTQADPQLSAAGEARAQKLALMLADAGVAAIFTTEYRRTKDTAQPLAAKLNVKPDVIPAGQAVELIAAIKAHANDTVLVVGHSNTVGAVIRALGGPAVMIGDNEYDSLFIFIPATGAFTRIRY